MLVHCAWRRVYSVARSSRAAARAALVMLVGYNPSRNFHASRRTCRTVSIM